MMTCVQTHKAYLPDNVVAASLSGQPKHPPLKVCLQLGHGLQAVLSHECPYLWAALQQHIADTCQHSSLADFLACRPVPGCTSSAHVKTCALSAD